MDVIGLAVELHQLGFEVGAHGPHDLFAARKDLVGERAAPVLGREDQMGAEGIREYTTLWPLRMLGFGSQRGDIDQRYDHPP